MAYREVAMWEILAVLKRIGRGESQAAVARTNGHTRKTIRRYFRTAKSLGWEPGTDPPSEALAAEVFLRHRPTGDRGPGEAEEELLPHLEAIRRWLTPGPRGEAWASAHQGQAAPGAPGHPSPLQLLASLRHEALRLRQEPADDSADGGV